MLHRNVRKITAVLLIALFSPVSSAADGEDFVSSQDALIRLSADRIDAVLTDVSASTRALAEEYVSAAKTLPAVTPAEKEGWLGRYTAQNETVIFQTWPGSLQSPPAFQAPQVAFFTYNGTNFSTETFRQLKLFKQLTPLFRAAYRTFDFSWSYLTTADNAMMIYPFLTLTEATNNYPPTQQVYYTSADFKNRRAGWTPPYLDLVGAGMMITVSFPAYDGDTLLGVVSHDITLDQLSQSVLSHLVLEKDATAYIVNHNGLVIGVTGDTLIQELDEINRKAGEAVLHYRVQDQLQQLGMDKAVPSANPWINNITEQLLTRANSAADNPVIRFEHDSRRVLATKTAVTEWYIVLVVPTGEQ